ncbi:hypothetical protein QBZ16_003678 [Prototheca wickerhamii]|uniref:Uncharacterized protein n=1 Tax=Prototheca wickerhamii TaxID=3111 RepID=A0AAD9IJQ0_PROWI|nr:hypothetical protein QBZ16_003678 [Prototheca wickerhamii]
MAAAAYRDATAAAAAVGSRIMALNLGPSKGPTGPQRSDSRYDGRGLGKDPLLSRYICNTAVGSDQRLALSNVLAQLTAAAAQEDKAGKTALASALRLLFLFERLTPEAAAQLAELLEREVSDPRLLKPIGHLLGAHVAGGCAGTPTTFHPALLRADDRASKAALATLSAALAAPALEPGVQRALLLLLAAAAIRASDEAATSGASPGAASDWALQHSVFLARARAASPRAPTRSRAAFPGSVALEMGTVVADAADAYALANGGDEAAADGEGDGSDAPADTSKKPSPITLSDPFARLALARLCARVVHSEGRASNVDGEGAPFWRMLCLLATRDGADVVRFGALEALVGGAEDAAGPLGRGGGVC